MTHKLRITTPDVVAMATIQHLAPSEIAPIAGISRQRVWRILKDAGVNTGKGAGGATRVTCECSYCGRLHEITRKRWRMSITHYCSTDCYYASRSNPNYYQWRHGTRLARIIISQWYPIQTEHVPHHIDGDDRNNDRANLMLFASQSDHIKYHHSKNHVEPIWDGRTV